MTCPSTRRGWLCACGAALLALTIPATVLAALASHYYVGTYSAGVKRGVVTVQLVEALPGGGGYIGWTTIDGLQYLGNIYVTGNTVSVTWYAAGGSYQVPLGTIQGTVSPDGKTITGKFRQGTRVGTCRLVAA